jgi:hypothetical protein
MGEESHARREHQLCGGNCLQRNRLPRKLERRMIELRRGGFQGVKVAGGNLRLAAAMRLGHAGMATLLSHVLTAIVLGRGHCGTRSGARHDGQHRQ